MIELRKEEMNSIYPLCMERKKDVVLSACVEGKLGRCWVDRKDSPKCAIVVAADFCFLLGSVEEIDDKNLIKILSANCRGKIIVTDDMHLGSIIEKNYPNNFKRFNRYEMKREPNIFEKEQLRDYILNIEPKFKIERIDKSLYYKVLEKEWTADFCCFFSSVEQFLQHGIGYVIIYDGEIISGASSYAYCEGSIEITIETLKEYRREGLALACASKLILECLEKSIYPRWDAANLISVALAEKLGYNFEKEYVVYSI